MTSRVFSSLTCRHAALLFVTAVAVFGAGLSQPPSGSDQLLHYSSVAGTSNPLRYFLSDVVTANYPYRPLDWLGQWTSYQLFGVWAVPDQLMSIVLHATVVALLLDVMLRTTPQTSDRLPMLFALVALISPYSVSAANWTPDRPTLLVALCLLLAVRHLFLDGARPRLGLVAALSVLAVLSKESGVIVAAVAAGYGAAHARPRFVALGAAVMGGYLALRIALFGAAAISYGESGSLFGLYWYEDSSQFTGARYVVMLADNAVKHLIAIALPIFGEEGDLLSGRALLVQAPLWLSTAALVVIAGTRVSRTQLVALAVIGATALVHAAVFRYRMLYISHLALMAYLAASPALTAPLRRRCAVIIATGLLLFSVFRVEQAVISNWREAYDTLASPEFGDIGDDHPIAVDPEVVRAIQRAYLH